MIDRSKVQATNLYYQPDTGATEIGVSVGLTRSKLDKCIGPKCGSIVFNHSDGVSVCDNLVVVFLGAVQLDVEVTSVYDRNAVLDLIT